MRPVRLSNLLAWVTIGMFALIAVGVGIAHAGATWWVVAVHSALAIVVGGALLLAAAGAWLGGRDRRARWLVTAATIGYPAQALLGVAEATDTAIVEGPVHFLAAIVLFSLLLLALVYELEAEGPADQAAPAQAIRDEPARHADGPPTASAVDRSQPWSARERLRAYVALTKPRLFWLLSLLAVAGMVLATTTGASLDGTILVATLLGGILAIGASGTFNHVYERDRDRRMSRTAERPLVTGAITPTSAFAFGVALLVGSMAIMLVFVNAIAAALTLAAVAYYAVGYTVILKPTTTWNIAVGGAAGAFPALIGWSAVTGGVDLPALLLAGVIVLWTPSHFYNLAIAKRTEYDAAGYPMLPVVKGVTVTRRRIVLAFGATWLSMVALGITVEFGLLYSLAIVGLGGLFLITVVQQYRHRTETAALRSFYASNLFLGGVLLVVVVEVLLV